MGKKSLSKGKIMSIRFRNLREGIAPKHHEPIVEEIHEEIVDEEVVDEEIVDEIEDEEHLYEDE